MARLCFGLFLIAALFVVIWMPSAFGHHGRGSHAVVSPPPTETVKVLTKQVEELADGTWSVGFRVRPIHSDGTSSEWGMVIDETGCHLTPIIASQMEG